MSGYLYLGGAVVLGLGFVYQAALLMKTEGDKRAMKTFGYSIIYLSLLFCFLLMDHYMVMAFPALDA
jgi:protoheme IX farnesyltransferase